MCENPLSIEYITVIEPDGTVKQQVTGNNPRSMFIELVRKNLEVIHDNEEVSQGFMSGSVQGDVCLDELSRLIGLSKRTIQKAYKDGRLPGANTFGTPLRKTMRIRNDARVHMKAFTDSFWREGDTDILLGERIKHAMDSESRSYIFSEEPVLLSSERIKAAIDIVTRIRDEAHIRDIHMLLWKLLPLNPFFSAATLAEALGISADIVNTWVRTNTEHDVLPPGIMRLGGVGFRYIFYRHAFIAGLVVMSQEDLRLLCHDITVTDSYDALQENLVLEKVRQLWPWMEWTFISQNQSRQYGRRTAEFRGNPRHERGEILEISALISRMSETESREILSLQLSSQGRMIASLEDPVELCSVVDNPVNTEISLESVKSDLHVALERLLTCYLDEEPTDIPCWRALYRCLEDGKESFEAWCENWGVVSTKDPSVTTLVCWDDSGERREQSYQKVQLRVKSEDSGHIIQFFKGPGDYSHQWTVNRTT